MTGDEMHAKLMEIFEETLNLEEFEVTDTTTADKVKVWDALTYIDPIIAFEHEFGSHLAMKKVANLAQRQRNSGSYPAGNWVDENRGRRNIPFSKICKPRLARHKIPAKVVVLKEYEHSERFKKRRNNG